MKRINTIVHIGVEKTATTTIQRFLAENKACLANAEIALLNSFGTNQRDLAGLCYDSTRIDDWTISYKERLHRQLDQVRKEIRSKLSEDVKLLNDTTAVLITSEHLHSRLTKISEVERFKLEMTDVGLNVSSIIIYLRRPWKLAQSLFSTLARGGYRQYSPPSPDHPIINPMCDYKYTIGLWRRAFPDARIHVRLYEEASCQGGILQDFISTISESTGRNSIFNAIASAPPCNENKSISREALSAIITLNNAIHDSAIAESTVVSEIRRQLELMPTSPTTPYKMERALVDSYDSFFFESCRGVEEEFFAGRSTELTEINDYSVIPRSPLDPVIGVRPLVTVLLSRLAIV